MSEKERKLFRALGELGQAANRAADAIDDLPREKWTAEVADLLEQMAKVCGSLAVKMQQRLEQKRANRGGR